MEYKVNDFLVDSIGHCFLCLSKIVSDPLSKCSVYSLQYISHFLKISRRHVFDEKLPVPLHLLEKVEKSLLKVSLCDICGALADKLEDQIKLLEKIQMEVNDGVNRIKDKLGGALRSEAEEGFKVLAEGNSIEMEKVNIVLRLRRESEKKCSLKLEQAQPRVRLKDVKKHSLKLEATTVDGGHMSDCDPTRLSVSSQKNLEDISSDYKSVPLNHTTDESYFRTNYNAETKTCRLCNAAFKYYWFKIHFESIHLKLRFACDVCGDIFTRRQILRQHLFKEHHQRYLDYKAEQDKKNGNESKPLKPICVPLSHKCNENELHLNYTNNTCRLCNKRFTSLTSFRYHFEAVHLNLRFVCDVCQYSCSGRAQLKDHMRRFHPEKYVELARERIVPEKGRKSRKSTARLNTVPISYKTNESELRENYLNNTCQLCNTKFSAFYGFKRHFERIHLMLRYKCDICNVVFYGRHTLKKHLLLRHPDYYAEHDRKLLQDKKDQKKTKKYNKSVKNKTLVSLNYVTDETKLLANFDDSTCLLCKKVLIDYRHFKCHFETIHLNLRFICDVCQATYSTRKNLQIHTRTNHPKHYRENYEAKFGSNFKCDVCSKGFSQRSRLRVHLLTNHPQQYQEYQSERTEVKVKTELVEMPV